MMKYTQAYIADIRETIDGIQGWEELKDKKILITGATGMIGSSVVELLHVMNEQYDAGITLYLAGRSKEKIWQRFSAFMTEKDFAFVPYDADVDQQFDIEPDYIIHGACKADPAAYREHPVETMLSNFVGVNTLLRLAVSAKSKRLLYLSSSEVYGKKEDNEPYKETEYGYVDILHSRACYPSSKRASETLCASYGAEYGVDTVIVRPGHIYGPTISRADSKASTQFTWNVVDGKDIVMKSAGDQVRSYCYTLDCAAAIVTVLLKGKNGEAYNISNRKSVVSIRDLAEMLARCGGKKIVFENPTDAEKRSYNLMSNSSLDAEKLEQLGWIPGYNLERGIKRTIEILQGVDV